jgi:hypothetical protein
MLIYQTTRLPVQFSTDSTVIDVQRESAELANFRRLELVSPDLQIANSGVTSDLSSFHSQKAGAIAHNNLLFFYFVLDY